VPFLVFKMRHCLPVADPEVLKREDNVSSLSSFIANAHNELMCLLHTGIKAY